MTQVQRAGAKEEASTAREPKDPPKHQDDGFNVPPWASTVGGLLAWGAFTGKPFSAHCPFQGQMISV